MEKKRKTRYPAEPKERRSLHDWIEGRDKPVSDYVRVSNTTVLPVFKGFTSIAHYFSLQQLSLKYELEYEDTHSSVLFPVCQIR